MSDLKWLVAGGCISLSLGLGMATQAFASENEEGQTPGTIRVQTPSCDVVLTKTPAKAGSSLVVLPVQTPFENLLANRPREITMAKYSPVSSDNRTQQEVAAQQLALEIARVLLSEEYLGSEEARIRTQDLLSTTLGKLPDGVLGSVQSILEADLASLNDPAKEPDYKVKTNNALAQLTQVLTEYREKGLDVNSLANQASKLSGLPLVGRYFKSVGDLLRERFQSVKQAIGTIDDVLEQSLAKMRVRHEQMKEARLELRVIERYLEISYLIAEEVERMALEYRDNNSDLSDEARQAFERDVLLPLAQRKQVILREQAAVITAYHQFRLLMDGNLDLIVVISNIRETAKLELTVFGAGKIIANEQARTLEMAQATINAMDSMREKTIEQMRQQGIAMRAFPEKMIKSTEKMIETIDQLLVEIQVGRDNTAHLLTRLNESSAVFEQKLEVAREKGGDVDLIGLSDSTLDREPGRKLKEINKY